MRVAHMAITASPSTTWPFSSITITRSASPSRAIPICAPRLTTSARAWSGCKAPASRLMLVPFGRTPMAWTRARARRRRGGPPRRPPVGGVHHHPRPVEGEVAGEAALHEGHVPPARVLESALAAWRRSCSCWACAWPRRDAPRRRGPSSSPMPTTATSEPRPASWSCRGPGGGPPGAARAAARMLAAELASAGST